ncbi:MAG: hypothetical protein ACR2IT_12920 [Pirellulales bacterium]
MWKNVIRRLIVAWSLIGVGLLHDMQSPVLAGTVYWAGTTSTAWTDSSNWASGLPPVAGDTVILNQGSPYTPVVSTSGNPTTGQIYLGVGGGLNIFSGGNVVMSDFITGNWGNSSGTIVTGGQMTMSGLLNLGGNGGGDGKIDISGGVVQSAALSINSTGGAAMNISGNGKYITDISQLNNVNYWVTNNIIKANNGAAGWSVVVDTTTDPTKVTLTAVPEPGVTAVAVVMGALAALRLRRR